MEDHQATVLMAKGKSHVAAAIRSRAGTSERDFQVRTLRCVLTVAFEIGGSTVEVADSRATGATGQAGEEKNKHCGAHRIGAKQLRERGRG